MAACNKVTTSNQLQPAASTLSQDEIGAGVIVYSDGGFAPASVSVKAGQSVVFKNTSLRAVQVNSNPHPAHKLYPELNIGVINAGESKSLSFTAVGTKKYHNHLNPSENGSIVVQ